MEEQRFKILKNKNNLYKLENRNLVAKTWKNTQSEMTAELSAPELSGALLNSVSLSFSNASKKEESLL
jgi:hypothetical protein